jgi:hypothetical protein
VPELRIRGIHLTPAALRTIERQSGKNGEQCHYSTIWQGLESSGTEHTMDRRVTLALLVLALLLLGVYLAVSYCGGITYAMGSSSEVVLSCQFPTPWSTLFGASPTYVVSVFFIVGLPVAILILAWLWDLAAREN